MKFEEAVKLTSNKDRETLYKDILKANSCFLFDENTLCGNQLKIMKYWYDLYYSVSNGETKRSVEDIEYMEVRFDDRNYNNLWIKFKDVEELKGVGMRWMCGAVRTDIGEVRKCLRIVIEKDIEDFGKDLDCFGYDIDHLYPFSYMVNDFMKLNNYKYERLNIVDCVISNKSLNKKFKKYHKRHCLLRLLESSENKKRSNNMSSADKWEVVGLYKNFEKDVKLTMLNNMGMRMVIKRN